MNIKHICFDLDGVLINSLEIMESSWLEAAQKYKLDINFNSYKKHIGIPFFDILYKLGIEESYWEKIKKTYDEISTTEINNIKKYEGVDNLLDYLSSKEISYSIFTSKTKTEPMKFFLNILKIRNLQRFYVQKIFQVMKESQVDLAWNKL